MTVAQFKERLASASIPERMRLIGRLLREARDTEVWSFLTPLGVCRQWHAITPILAGVAHFGSSYFTAGMKKVCLESDKLTPLQRDFLEAFLLEKAAFFSRAAPLWRNFTCGIARRRT